MADPTAVSRSLHPGPGRGGHSRRRPVEGRRLLLRLRSAGRMVLQGIITVARILQFPCVADLQACALHRLILLLRVAYGLCQPHGCVQGNLQILRCGVRIPQDNWSVMNSRVRQR
jgi:hypothetical protein